RGGRGTRRHQPAKPPATARYRAEHWLTIGGRKVAPRGKELATGDFLEAIRRKGRHITFASPGSEELRYLDWMKANANVGGGRLTLILLREDARKIEVLEEFLHG